jgi:chorismate mutase
MGSTSDRDISLADIRQELDVIDVALVEILARRSQRIIEVIRYKRAHSMSVVDRSREDEMLDHIEVVARSKDLDPRVARHVLRAVIDAFTLLEVEELEPASPEGPQGAEQLAQ